MTTGKETVLVVEDDEGIALLERRALERSGYQVKSVTNIPDALAAIRAHRFDLIVADYRLEEATGLDLLKQVQSLGFDLPVILVTGFSNESTVIDAIRCGVRDFVPKTMEYLRYLPKAAERVLSAVRTERELAKSEARFQLFMDNNPAAAFIKDEEGRLVYANRTAQQLLGCADWLGKSDLELWPIESAHALRENDLAALRHEHVVQNRESLTCPDGVLRHFDSYKFPMCDARGQRLLGGMAVDVTQQLAVQQALRERDEQLRQSQKMEAVGTLAGGVAHEFNNLLQAVLGYTRFAMSAIAETHVAQEDLKVVVTAGERAAQLTQQLLSFSRRESSELQPLDVNTAIRDVANMLRPLLGESVSIKLALDEGIPPVMADAAQVQQMLMNLCINARDAMAEGGTMTISTCEHDADDIHPKQHLVAPGGYVRICVADEGCGMSEETKQKIFEPFFTTKPVGKGTGLGLAMVYSVVEHHKGTVHVESQPGNGARFVVNLPRSGEHARLVSSAAHEPVAVGSETILLAEDEQLILDLTKRALERCGYRVLVASDGREALRSFEENHASIDLVILDAVMPQLNGSEALHAIRAIKPSVPAIFCTGWDRGQTPRTPLGPQPRFIQKPFQMERLLMAVREVFEESYACHLD
jgi:two-component system cell cycle sensor histidine kinase/response regulator CckA